MSFRNLLDKTATFKQRTTAQSEYGDREFTLTDFATKPARIVFKTTNVMVKNLSGKDYTEVTTFLFTEVFTIDTDSNEFFVTVDSVNYEVLEKIPSSKSNHLKFAIQKKRKDL